MKTIPLLVAIGALSVAACGSSVDITKPPVPYQAKRQIPAAQFRGDDTFTVRTVRKTGDGTKEVTGASCSFETTYTASKFQSPVILVTPNLGPATPAGHISCSDGEKDASMNIDAINKSLRDRVNGARNSGAGGGIIGAIAGGITAGIVKGRGDRPDDIFGYDDSRIRFDYTEE